MGKDDERCGAPTGIDAVHEAIRCGDVYQANLTRRYKLHGQFDLASLFSKLLLQTQSVIWLG